MAGADEVRIAGVKRLAEEAWRIEWGLDRTRRETIAVTRVGKREIEERPYGIALGVRCLRRSGRPGF